MNFAHIHLILNHIPMAFLGIGLITLLVSFRNKSEEVFRLGLWLLIAGGAAAAAAYWTGEPAEEFLEGTPYPATKAFLEPHEQAGGFALVLSIMAAIAAFASLITLSKEKPFYNAWLSWVCLGVSGLGLVTLLYTGFLGGQIAHSEARSTTAVTPADTGKVANEKEAD